MVSPKTLKNTSKKAPSLSETAYVNPKDKRLAFISDLKSEFKQFNFISSNRFKWHPEKSIYFDKNPDIPFEYFALQTLHELGHALEGHKDYKTDVKRLKMESEAWERARELLKTHKTWTTRYKITYDEDFAEDNLDTYRDWLHKKSKCKICGLTRYQKKNGKWFCPKCNFSTN